jgi:hypothetical protein
MASRSGSRRRGYCPVACSSCSASASAHPRRSTSWSAKCSSASNSAGTCSLSTGLASRPRTSVRTSIRGICRSSVSRYAWRDQSACLARPGGEVVRVGASCLHGGRELAMAAGRAREATPIGVRHWSHNQEREPSRSPRGARNAVGCIEARTQMPGCRTSSRSTLLLLRGVRDGSVRIRSLEARPGIEPGSLQSVSAAGFGEVVVHKMRELAHA